MRADQFPYTTTIETKQIYSTSQLLSTLTGQGVQVTKAIVGRNAFAHVAGIHQDRILKDRRTYEIMAAEDVDPERREPLTDGPQARCRRTSDPTATNTCHMWNASPVLVS